VLTALSVSVFVALIGVGLFYLSELAGMNLRIRWREWREPDLHGVALDDRLAALAESGAEYRKRG
jgi:hypothetical protein